jgi:hypothetical protein
MELIFARTAPAGVYVAFALALTIWHVAAALLAVFIAHALGVSDSSPDLKKDVKKMSACSLIALSLFLALFSVAPSPVVFLVYVLVFIFTLKFAYLGANHGFLLIVLGTVMAGMIGFAFVLRWLRLPGLFFLYLVFAMAGLILYGNKRRRDAEDREAERRKELALRARLRDDADFSTFCYRCLFCRPSGARCQLKIDGETVREITIGPRTYCTSFRQDPASGIHGGGSAPADPEPGR